MNRVKKIIPFLKGETPLQAIERLKQFKCRFCNIVEI